MARNVLSPVARSVPLIDLVPGPASANQPDWCLDAGAWSYEGRLIGLVASAHGNSPELRGQFMLRNDASLEVSRRVLAPPLVLRLVLEQFSAHPHQSTRRRTVVAVDLDYWRVGDDTAALGWRPIISGRAWVPDFLSVLAELSATRPVPQKPTAGTAG